MLAGGLWEHRLVQHQETPGCLGLRGKATPRAKKMLKMLLFMASSITACVCFSKSSLFKLPCFVSINVIYRSNDKPSKL